MSTERDELYNLIEGTFDDLPRVYEALADAVLAAGYRKPRTIESLAELAALPAESAVQTSDTSDTVVLKGGDGLFMNAFGGEVGADDLWRYGTKPFTVIYEPEGP